MNYNFVDTERSFLSNNQIFFHNVVVCHIFTNSFKKETIFFNFFDQKRFLKCVNINKVFLPRSENGLMFDHFFEGIYAFLSVIFAAHYVLSLMEFFTGKCSVRKITSTFTIHHIITFIA